jgi:GNAT superfamily N-acetyltransferase
VHIRPFQPADTDDLYRVCLRTGNDGEDATGLYADPRILGEVYVGPYLAFEPDSALVVDRDGTAAAYALCAPDTAAFQRRCAEEWWPALRARYPRDAFPPGSLDDEAVAILYDPPRTDPGLLASYPAHLHIDLTPEVQGRGFGGDMMRLLLDGQAAAGVPGIHLEVATANVRAIGFYEHLDFTTLRVEGATTIMGRTLTA